MKNLLQPGKRPASPAPVQDSSSASPAKRPKQNKDEDLATFNDVIDSPKAFGRIMHYLPLSDLPTLFCSAPAIARKYQGAEPSHATVCTLMTSAFNEFIKDNDIEPKRLPTTLLKLTSLGKIPDEDDSRLKKWMCASEEDISKNIHEYLDVLANESIVEELNPRVWWLDAFTFYAMFNARAKLQQCLKSIHDQLATLIFDWKNKFHDANADDSEIEFNLEPTLINALNTAFLHRNTDCANDIINFIEQRPKLKASVLQYLCYRLDTISPGESIEQGIQAFKDLEHLYGIYYDGDADCNLSRDEPHNTTATEKLLLAFFLRDAILIENILQSQIFANIGMNHDNYGLLHTPLRHIVWQMLDNDQRLAALTHSSFGFNVWEHTLDNAPQWFDIFWTWAKDNEKRLHDCLKTMLSIKSTDMEEDAQTAASDASRLTFGIIQILTHIAHEYPTDYIKHKNLINTSAPYGAYKITDALLASAKSKLAQSATVEITPLAEPSGLSNSPSP